MTSLYIYFTDDQGELGIVGHARTGEVRMTIQKHTVLLSPRVEPTLWTEWHKHCFTWKKSIAFGVIIQ